MNIARVFPSRTKATPVDPLAYSCSGKDKQHKCALPGAFPPEVDEVHISVSFTWDIEHAYWLAEQWQKVAPVKIGGPAFNKASGEFLPGRYLRPGYTITSRGCPNRCWFCSVWKREPKVKELPIHPGWNLQDDNILACSEQHIRKVFAMLKQSKRRVEFTGGIEPGLLEPWHVELFQDLRPDQVFFSYDSYMDFGHLKTAAKMMYDAGFIRNRLRAYVLCGYKKDSFADALARMKQVLSVGMYPMAMLYVADDGTRDEGWCKFQNNWTRPARIAARIKKGLV